MNGAVPRGLSRRGFARLMAAGTSAALLAPQVAARGWEARHPGERVSAKLLPKDPLDLILLNSNENPYGPSPRALEAMVEAHEVCMRYPDYYADQLSDKLASLHGVAPANLIVTCGSTELLKLATQAFLGPGKRLVVPHPFYEDVPYYAGLTGAEAVEVPVRTDFHQDVEAMARAAREKPGLVYLCNPNNPTAVVEPAVVVEKLMAQMPGDGVLLVDEAYHHYVDDGDYRSMIERAKSSSNLVVARTFSKIYGMAGLRLGYGIASAELIERMRPHKVRMSWNVMACAAALVSLDDQDWVRQNQERNRAARVFLTEAMAQRGREVIPSQANFACVEVPVEVREAIQGFRREGISVGRRFPGLERHLRVSVGTIDEMEKFVAAYDRLFGAEQARRARV